MALATRASFQDVAARALVLWHLLSLDAPTVAVLWTWTIARRSHIPLPASSLAAMALAVWILYAADRLLDANAPAAELEARHRFHARYRRPFRLALAAAVLFLAPLLPLLSPAALHLYLLLAALLFAWFLLIHARSAWPRSRPRRLPKEIAVGIFFSAAVFIPSVSRAPALRLRLLAPAVLFAALCSLNCLFIYAWEHPTQRSRSHAHRLTRRALRHLPSLTWSLLVAALTMAWSLRSELPLPIALSAALLLALDRRKPLDANLLRAAADLALLTPILFVF